jgi:hypothetical protein
MAWQLTVVDGADADRFFLLPTNGTAVVGSSHKHADICLNDLYVARTHCEIETEGDRIVITAMTNDKETIVNGQRVRQHMLMPGEVFRVGNSHLRLEEHADALEAEIVDDTFEVLDDESLSIADTTMFGLAPEGSTAGATVKMPAPSVKSGPAPRIEWDELDQLSGYQLAHFKIGPMLGRGHFGAVFRARDTEHRREVALKIIAPNFPAATVELQRFGKAIGAVAKTQEEHLVTWFSAGRSGHYCWIAQELIEGNSLAEILKNLEPSGKQRWVNALKLGLDLATALDAMFQRRIIHGNLTPANVLVTHDRTAKLNDLMFQQALLDSEWQQEKIEGKLLSEMAYLPPERVQPGAYWDASADIYSLGAIVYARLTGRPPHQGDTPGDTIERILHGKLELPKKLVKETPDLFQTVILKMLKASQEERYQNPVELKDALLQVQSRV